jgi:sec-independent protein translocase protein TatC
VDDKEYSLFEHLAELRKRVGRAVVGVAILSFVAFGLADALLEVIRGPMVDALRAARPGDPNAHFIVHSAAEYLVCQMKAALVVGCFLGSPWVLYQMWLFVAPGLYEHEQRYVTGFVWAGALFFIAGGVFCYFVVMPSMITYLVTATPDDIAIMPGLEENFTFVLKMLLGFGVAFQTPVIIFVLSLAGIVDPSTLGRWRRHVIMVCMIVGAVLTPTPDALSMFLLAGPLYVLFELGVLVSRITIAWKGKPLDRAARAAAERAAAERAATDGVVGATTDEPARREPAG